jgi:hypothetical protein
MDWLEERKGGRLDPNYRPPGSLGSHQDVQYNGYRMSNGMPRPTPRVGGFKYAVMPPRQLRGSLRNAMQQTVGTPTDEPQRGF